MKLHTITFGCQMSAADGEELARPLAARGFTPTEALDEADAVVVNTCTVRQHAEDRALSLLGRLKPWKETRPERFLIVAGCAAERLGESLAKRFPHVDLVVGAKSIEDYPRVLEDALAARFDFAAEQASAWAPGQGGAPAPSGVSQFLTIMRGCNYSCSYCIVPAVRGRELYRPLDTVLREARARAAAGAKELTLLGQTVNSWRRDGLDFADLLREVCAVDGIERVRFMSPHPFFVGPRLVEAFASLPELARHLHLPVQSGDDRILKLMRRNYTAASYREAARRAREDGGIVDLTTDFIVGFPGETEDEFRRTLDLAASVDFSAAYCFKFSPREGTDASSYDGVLPDEVVEERLRRLLALTEARRVERMKAWVGRRVRVLALDERGGSTEGFFPARLDEAGLRPGALVDAVVTGTAQAGLRARAC